MTTPLFRLTFGLIVVFVSVGLACCSRNRLQVTSVVSNLRGGQSVVAWTSVDTSAIQVPEYLSVAFQDSNVGIEELSPDVFEAKHGREIALERVSEDTIRVHYMAWEVSKQETLVRGIRFLYEGGSKIFADSSWRSKWQNAGGFQAP